MANRVTKIWLVIGVPVALMVVTVAASELVVRGYLWLRGWTPNCYAASLDLYVPDEQRGNELRADFRLRSGVFHISTNARGLRGPEIVPAHQPGSTRIAILGGSSAFGYLVNDGQEAARVLEKKLTEAGHPVQIINGAVPGYNLHQTISRFRERICPLDPDIVILYLGWNDLLYVCSDEPDRYRRRPVASSWERALGHSALYGLVAYRLSGGTTVGAPPAPSQAQPTSAGASRFRDNLQELAKAITECDATMIVCTQCMAAHPDAGEGVRALVSGDPRVVEQMTGLGQWLTVELRQFAQQHDAPLLDVYSEMPPNVKYLADYIHLTVDGEQQLARLLFQRLEPMLKPPQLEPGC